MKTTTHKNSNTLLKSAKRHLNQGVSLDLIRQGKGAWREDNKTRLDEIALMQTALNSRGFSTGKPDGYYGKNTVQGVKGFQRNRGLTADGIFGKRTLYALEQQVGKLGGKSVSTAPKPTPLQPTPTPSHGLTTNIDTSKHGDGGTVKVHSKCLYNSPVVGTLPSGTMVQIDNTTATWAKIPYGNKTDYVLAKFIKGTASYDRKYTDDKRYGSQGMYYSSNQSYKKEPLKMQTNAQYIYDYLKNQGWKNNPIFAVLGNMQVESTLNPGVWEGRKPWNESNGFGLTQWTSAKDKILPYAQAHLAQIDDIDIQLKRLCEEMTESNVPDDKKYKQWSSKNVGGMKGEDFISSTKPIAELTALFVRGYERPPRPDYKTREDYALKWATKLNIQP